MDLTQIITLVSLISGTGVATEIVKGIIAWINGKTAEKREHNKQIEEQRQEDSIMRHVWREHAFDVRNAAQKHGVTSDQLPALPKED